MNLYIKISKSAKKFIEEKDIRDVTFNLIEDDVAGCCVGVVKDIVPVYKAPANAAGYRYYLVNDFHIFVSRKIRIIGPLMLTTEGIWNKRLYLSGATIPI